MTNPIFILSLPRSGSTLLQRLLASHPAIDSIAEPWVLLPFFAVFEERTVYAEYGHMTLHKAFKNVLDKLPNGVNDYYEIIHDNATMLYERMSKKEARYFLDKTPRYYLIAEHVMQTFPDAKVIFLWRNPLSIAASLLTMSSEQGTWKDFYRYKVDIYKGFDNLFQTFTVYEKRGLFLNYEEMVSHPVETLNKLGDFLEIQFSPDTLESFSSFSLQGSLGDQRGVTLYRGISNKSINRWKQVLCTPVRKRWAVKYLDWIGKERLLKIGYDYNMLLQELIALRPCLRRTMIDWSEYIFYRLVYAILDPTIIKFKIRQIFNGERTYPLF